MKTSPRRIWWRVTLTAGRRVHGELIHLKTLRGATEHLRRIYPEWREVEVQFEPFAQVTA